MCWVEVEGAGGVGGGHLEEGVHIGAVSCGEEADVVEGGDAVWGVEVDDGVCSQAYIDSGFEHFFEGVRAEGVVVSEVGVGSWTVGDGGLGLGELVDGVGEGWFCCWRIVDMGAEDGELFEDGEEVGDGVFVFADLAQDGVVPDTEAFEEASLGAGAFGDELAFF